MQECAKQFPVLLSNSEGQLKQEKYTLTSLTDSIKSNIVLCGDTIIFGEISFKIQRHQYVTYKTAITHDNPWKLQQIQDAANHLQQALRLANSVEKDYNFNSSEEVLHVLGKVLSALQRGRTSLIIPRKKTIDDLMKSRNMVCF
mgnify:CR=1 FL=1